VADEPDVIFGKWLVALKRAVQNPVATLKRIGALVTSRTQKRFDTQVGPDGKEWPDRMTPNIPGILEDLERGAGIKDRRWQPRPVLLDTGNLRWSINWALEGTEVVKIGTSVDHAKFHQFGLERVIPITATMKAGIRQMLVKFRGKVKRVNKKRAKAGLMSGVFGQDPTKLAFLLHRDEFRFKILERPFIGIDDQDQADIFDLVQRQFPGDAVKDAGL
jgi:phage gpG-like protein